MSHIPIPPQEELLRYDANFNAAVDHTFLQSLVFQKRQNGWNIRDIPGEALEATRRTVNYVHDGALTLTHVKIRFRFMEIRFLTVKEVANFHGALPDFPNNVIYAEDHIWDQIFNQNSFAIAYRYKGDPEFKNLSILFGDEDIKVESSNTEVVATSPVGANRKAAQTVIVSDDGGIVTLSDDDEVSSPNIKPTCRNLFGSGKTPDDTQSTTGRRGSRIPTFLSRRPGGSTSKRATDGNSSSSASCSPAKFAWGPFK